MVQENAEPKKQLEERQKIVGWNQGRARSEGNAKGE